MNKSDLSTIVDESEVRKYIDKTILSYFCKENQGIDELEDAIKNMFFDGTVSFNDEVYITNAT